MEQIEAVVDVVEPKAPCQELVDGKPPLLVQVDIPGNVARRHAGADIAALERSFFRDEAHRGQRQYGRRLRQTGGHSAAAAARDAVREFQGTNRARELEGK